MAQLHSGVFRKISAAMLCLLLSVFMTVEAAHSHATQRGEAAAAHCPICSAAHHATTPVTVRLLPTPFERSTLLRDREVLRGSKPRVLTFSIRPPPACC